jgi:hypothetical protein
MKGERSLTLPVLSDAAGSMTGVGRPLSALPQR